MGFFPFYAHGKAYGGHDLPHPILTLTVLHGFSMTAWVLLFLIQPLLIDMGQHQSHKLLGRAGAILAIILLILGWRLAIESALIAPSDFKVAGFLPKQFMIVPMFNILAFAGFALAGITLRRHPTAHRPLMLLATLAIMSAAISRIDSVTALYQDTLWQRFFGPFFGMLALGGFLLTAKILLEQKFDRWFTMGYAVLVLGSAMTISLAPSPLWNAIANHLLRSVSAT